MSNPSYAALTDTALKIAAELPDDMQFESDFASMAQAFVRDRAQGLVPYILGFEIVNRVPDGSKGVGVFVARIEDDYYYIPVFFLNGGVRGMDFLYSKKTNSFLPLIDEVVSSVVNRVHVDLGAPVRGSNELLGSMDNPDFSFMQAPGTARKVSAVSEDDMALAEVVRERASKKPWYSAGFTRVKREDVSDDEFNAAKARNAAKKKALAEESADSVIADAQGWVSGVESETLKRAADGDPYILQTMRDFTAKLAGSRGPDDVAFTHDIQDVLAATHDVTMPVKLASLLRANPELALCALNTFYPTPESLLPVVEPAEKTAATKQGAVNIITSANDMPADAPPTERRRLVRDRLAVIDTRDAAGLSRALPVQMTESVQNPDQSGVYNLLLSNGTVVKAWVFTQHKAVGGHDGKTLVVHPKERLSFAADNDAVFTFSEAEADISKILDAAIPANRITVEDSYVAIDRSGKTFGPFSVETVTKDTANRKLLAVVYNTWVNAVPGGTHLGTWDTTEYYVAPKDTCGTRRATVVMSPFDGNLTLQRNGDVVRVTLPADARLIKISRNFEVSEAVRAAFHPTTRSELSANFAKCAAVNLRAHYDPFGKAYGFRLGSWAVDGLSRKEALTRLVVGAGFTAQDADLVMDKAAAAPPSAGARVLVKLGQAYMPPFPMPQFGSEQLVNQTVLSDPYLEQSVQGMTMPQMAPPLPSSTPGMNLAHTMSGGGVMDIGGQPGEEQGGGDVGQLMSLAQGATQAGQKSVFDHALLGSLAKTYDTGAVIDSLAPKLRVALDALGRILFLFYWKQEDWEKRFGDSNSGDTEDQLRSLFKQLGAVTLMLEQKDVPTSPGSGGS